MQDYQKKNMITESTVDEAIAVFGSWRTPEQQQFSEIHQESTHHFTHTQSKEAFDSTCREIAVQLAQAGKTMIVASESPNTIDFQIVTGILAQVERIQNRVPCIQVVRSGCPLRHGSAQDCRRLYDDAISDFPELFHPPIERPELKEWQEVHDEMVGLAHHVIVIGGGQIVLSDCGEGSRNRKKHYSSRCVRRSG
jgi:hypothetical protein